jgi:hypothetical protein
MEVLATWVSRPSEMDVKSASRSERHGPGRGHELTDRHTTPSSALAQANDERSAQVAPNL